jgi:tripartite-type tricarboxylate transporter receptor subunit TctC
MTHRAIHSSVAGLALGLLASGAALAQAYPARPVKVIIGYEAGGSTDITARFILRQFEKRINQTLIVENRPGASGALAGHALKRAEPDGHTLLFASGTGFHEIFLKDNPIDASKEFAAIGTSTSTPMYIFVRAGLPASSAKDFIAYAKANPGKLNFGGTATSMILVMELFEARAGTTSVKVPYKGSAPVVTAMLAGQVDVTASVLSAFLPAVQSGKVTPLFSTRKSAIFPELPTAADLGIPDLDVASTLGFWAPRGTPEPVVRTLSSANAASVKSAEVVAELRRQDSSPVGSTPEEAIRAFHREVQFWTEAAKLAGPKP